LARAISWGVPILTTTAGLRGYKWHQGALLVSDEPSAMAALLVEKAGDMDAIIYWKEQTRLIAENGLTQEELAQKIRYLYT
jgi:hypothetical protein